MNIPKHGGNNRDFREGLLEMIAEMTINDHDTPSGVKIPIRTIHTAKHSLTNCTMRCRKLR